MYRGKYMCYIKYIALLASRIDAIFTDLNHMYLPSFLASRSDISVHPVQPGLCNQTALAVEDPPLSMDRLQELWEDAYVAAFQGQSRCPDRFVYSLLQYIAQVHEVHSFGNPEISNAYTRAVRTMAVLAPGLLDTLDAAEYGSRELETCDYTGGAANGTGSVEMEEQIVASIVTVTRNDDYGVGSVERLQNMLRSAAAVLQDVRSEIIIVDYNQVQGQASVADLLQALLVELKNSYKSIDFRVIAVPPEIHRSLPGWRTLPLPEMAANIGMRRARGTWVARVNSDQILLSGLKNMWSRLNPNFHYKAVYYELDFEGMNSVKSILTDGNFQQQVIERQANLDFFDCASDALMQQTTKAASSFEAMYWLGTGDFVLLHRDALHAARGYIHVAQGMLTDDVLPCRLAKLGFPQVVLGGTCGTVHQNHVPLSRVRSDASKWFLTDSKKFCGDDDSLFARYSWEPADWGWGQCSFLEITW